MNNKINKYLFLIILLFSFSQIQNKVYAEENMAPTFTVKANLPDNQEEDVSGYFHLSMISGKTQEVTVDVTNTTDETITVSANIATATTNSNGVLNYQNTEETIDDSVVLNFEDFSLLSENEVILQEFETKTVTLSIKIPETDFEGQILGGISFEEKKPEDEEEQSSMVVNRFSYTIAVMIELGDEMPENEIQLNEIYAAQRSGFNFIELNVQNTTAKLISSLSVEAEIFRYGEETPLYSANRTGLKMAPNSNFNYGIDLQQTPILAADYVAKVTIMADDKRYEFEEMFSITTDEAQHLNESAVLIEVKSNNTFVYVMISIALAILFGLVVLILIKKYKSNEK